MIRRSARLFLTTVALLTLVLQPLTIVQRPSAQQLQQQPTLILISFDGWRWDYLDHADTPNLRALAARGVRSDGLLPSFPSKTFPNHYTIVTGLYPAHHGIVSNNMVDRLIPERFMLSSDEAKQDGRWWGGEPIWVTAIRQGKRASSLFWPGDEAPIAGVRPTAYMHYDGKMPNADRVKQVLQWLALPPTTRPSFVSMYFEEVDDAGHHSAPLSPQVLEAAHHLDTALGDLIAGVKSLGLLESTTFVVVSDHGMAALSDKRVIFLDDYIDLSKLDVIDWTPVPGFLPSAGSAVDEIYRTLRNAHPALKLYKRDDLPSRFHYRDNPRIPPLVGVVQEGWMLTSHARYANDLKTRTFGGDHGYDPDVLSMHALFVTAGPRIRHRTIRPFRNIHIYDFMCDVLGLQPAKNDGDPKVLAAILEN